MINHRYFVEVAQLFSDTDLTHNNSTNSNSCCSKETYNTTKKVSLERNIEPVTDSMCMCMTELLDSMAGLSRALEECGPCICQFSLMCLSHTQLCTHISPLYAPCEPWCSLILHLLPRKASGKKTKKETKQEHKNECRDSANHRSQMNYFQQ